MVAANHMFLSLERDKKTRLSSGHVLVISHEMSQAKDCMCVCHGAGLERLLVACKDQGPHL